MLGPKPKIPLWTMGHRLVFGITRHSRSISCYKSPFLRIQDPYFLSTSIVSVILFPSSLVRKTYQSPETIKQFRPISLCNMLYKLVTKILVTRLKPLIPAWISHNQNSFIKGRSLNINLVVASEILHSMKRKIGKGGWFALKIDLEKAYDQIEWSFVRECLQNFQMDPVAINLIMDCISKAYSCVLINGRKSEKFDHTRGLRQGDLMSP